MNNAKVGCTHENGSGEEEHIQAMEKASFTLSTVSGVFLLLLAQVYADEFGCGGILKGTSGSVSYDSSDGRSARANCLWMINPDKATGVTLTVKEISDDSSVLFYKEGRSEPLKTMTQASQSVGYPGNRFLVVFPVQNNSSRVSFEWETYGEVEDGGMNRSADVRYEETSMRHTVFYGNITWSIAYVVSLEKQYSMNLTIKIEGEEGQCESGCWCFSADVFEVLPNGRLNSLFPQGICVGSESVRVYENSQIVVWGTVATSESEAVEYYISCREQLKPPTGTTPGTTSTTAPGFANTIFANQVLVLLGLITYALHVANEEI